MPGHVQGVIDRIEGEIKKEEAKVASVTDEAETKTGKDVEPKNEGL